MRRRALAALSGLLALGACSSPSNTPYGAPPSIPTTNVVAAVRTDSSVAAAVPASVRKAGTLTFGTTLLPGTSNLPYEGSVDGHDVGLHIDLANAVAKVLGLRAVLVNGTFPTIVPGVQNGRYDVGLANFGVTAEREKVVDYATYLTDGQAFLGSKNVSLAKARTLTDLCGLTIATLPGSTFQQLLENGKGACVRAGRKPYGVQYFSDTAPVVLGLLNGTIDANFGPTLNVKYESEHIPGTKFLGQISSTPVGFVTAKGSPLAGVLRNAVDRLIATGVYGRLVRKWGVAANAIRRSVINPKPSF